MDEQAMIDLAGKGNATALEAIELRQVIALIFEA
jgi:hypothetical protein